MNAAVGIIAAEQLSAAVGGGGYTAPAVHFDGSTKLEIASMTATDSFDVMWSGWFKTTTAKPFFCSDPDDTANSLWYVPSIAPADGYGAELGDIPFVNTVETQSRGVSSIDGEWHHCIFAANTNHALGSRVLKFYVDDVGITPTPSADFGIAFKAAFNGVNHVFGSDGFDFFTGDIADFRLFIGPVILVAGDIPLATRRLFIDADGKPVAPSVATATLGAGDILFSGGASAFGTNQGTGGAFTITGSLTDASTSPSD